MKYFASLEKLNLRLHKWRVPITATSQWLPLAKKAVLLMVIAFVPATGQLAFGGFSPPIHVPFGIEADDVQNRPEPIVWVDARSEDLFGTDHIPSALNLNQTNWNQALPRLFEAYQPGKTVIVYCSSGCSASEEIASKIRDLGIEPVLVLEGGFEAWQKTPHR